MSSLEVILVLLDPAAHPQWHSLLIRCSLIETATLCLQLGSLSPATHAYAAWEGFPASAMIAIGKLFVATPSLRAIAVVQRAFRCKVGWP